MGASSTAIRFEPTVDDLSVADPCEQSFVCLLGQDPALLRALSMQVQELGIRLTGCTMPSELTTLLQMTDINCVIAETHLQGNSVWELLDDFSEHDEPVPVVVFSTDVTVAIAVRAMKAGAFDCIKKECPDSFSDVSTLVDSISRALEHGRSLRIKGGPRRQAQRRMSRLTHRERQVFQLVAEGNPNKHVAHRLGIADKTVETHRSRVMSKMEAGTLAELVRIAFLLGMLKDAPVAVPPRERVLL